ncbi:hypothetical protein AAD018_004560 [Aestuariibius insulae]|uniref:hypothetical protein n=1 Tax=Aestuariibius insulae TaxID=2058287 RepID=UPI00345EDAA6
MQNHPIGSAPDYTNAFMAMSGLILFMTFFVIAAAVGYLWVFLTAFGLNKMIALISRKI